MVARETTVPKLDTLLADLRDLIESARAHVAQSANATVTMLYWHIGQRIQREVLKNARAEYGEQIVENQSQQLSGSHFIEILPLKQPLEREYYAELCRVERAHLARERG